ncbi:MAG: aspartate aminotransferase family protein [Thermoanaerobaculia bacterium]
MSPRRPAIPSPDLDMEAGDLLPEVVVPPPGPRSRELSRHLARSESPGVDTLGGGDASVVWQAARGANVLDVDGNRFLDLTAGFGVAAVGHRHPRVVAAVREQSGRLLHGLGDVAAHPGRIELARRLAALAPVDEPRVYPAISGADAVEIAAKTAILATGRPGLVAFDPSYHGVTLGALALSARPDFRLPFARHIHPHVRRLPFASEAWRLDRLLRRHPVAAVVLEPVVGREGVIPPPPGWLTAVAELCRERDVLLVADEIFTGFGRTGTLFAVDAAGVRPDLLCCGKALAGGLPIGAVVGRSPLMEAWRHGSEALHTATFLGHPLACAAALAVLDVLEEDALPERARRLGDAVAERLRPWPERYPAVAETRGRGLLQGVELTGPTEAKRLTAALLARGVLALAGGPRGTVLQIVPPLTITDEQLTVALDLMEGCLREL